MVNLRHYQIYYSKKQVIQTILSSSNPVQRVNLHQTFKTYRNQIITLNRRSKENYFKMFFEINKKDLKKIWDGIKTLISTKSSKKGSHQLILNIDYKTTSDDYIIANHFNSFFTSIAGKILKKIAKAKKAFNSFLTKSNTKTLFLSSTTPGEVTSILKNFNLNKAVGPNSLPITILKDLKSEIAEPLCTLINLSFNTGVFPNSLKLAKVIPVFKNVTGM